MAHERPSLFDSNYEILFALDFSFYIVYTVIDISLRFVFQLPINCFLQRDAFIYFSLPVVTANTETVKIAYIQYYAKILSGHI